ncbi:MAG: hypothetical protein J2P55_08025 [Rhizobiales bacterium]|nr:hypothetical protein [Hyphomicrobiales bacterium]
MKGRILIAATAALAAASPLFVPAARAADPAADTQPGFVPDTGQINPGHAAQPASAAPPLPQDQQPAQEDARAALMMPDNGAPSAGQSAGQGAGQAAGQGAGQGGQGTGQGAAQATPPAPNSGGRSDSGNESSAAATSAAPSGPIGATIQTMPAKFSHRNDVLDHMPMMAWPLPLDAQQRQQIYQAVMADKSPPPADTAKLKPASALSLEQRRDMHPLPESLASIDGLQGLKYIKGKDKVLLVRPSTGIVVDEVTM